MRTVRDFNFMLLSVLITRRQCADSPAVFIAGLTPLSIVVIHRLSNVDCKDKTVLYFFRISH